MLLSNILSNHKRYHHTSFGSGGDGISFADVYHEIARKYRAIDARAIKSSPAPSYFEAIENLKGVQLLTSSLGFKVYNTRGFANPTNVRFVQLVDGADNQAPHIGAPIGSALAPTDLDIDRVELIPGTASALYGMNALNGMVQILSKNPLNIKVFLFNKKQGLIIWAMPMLQHNFLQKPLCVGQRLGIIDGL
jgi:hypothetical protein